MSKKNRIEEANAKEFSKSFDALCTTRARWEAWNDFVHLAAYSISNLVDEIHREKRETDYLKIAERYTSEELSVVSHLLAITVLALEENPDQDFLGELYMRLELGNSHAGQFFTPYNVGKMMALINVDKAISNVERNGYVSVMDCCVGGGALLIGFANACKEKELNYQRSVLFVAQDIDHTVGMMAYIQLSLMGCPGYVVIGNSLTEPLTGDPLFAPMERETFVTPMYCTYDWECRRRYHLMMKAVGINSEKKEAAPIANDKTNEETIRDKEAAETDTPASNETETEVIQLTFDDLFPLVEKGN